MSSVRHAMFEPRGKGRRGRRVSETPIGRCEYCNRLCYASGSAAVLANPLVRGSRDHAVPRHVLSSADILGQEQDRYTILACAECNQVKGPHPEDIYRAWRADNAVTSVSTATKQFNVFVFAIAVVGWRHVVRQARLSRPARSIADIVAKVRS